MNGTHLLGLEGTNPLAFLAALGLQVAFATEDRQQPPRLWWSDDTVPHAVVDKNFTVDLIVDRALSAFECWKCSPAINPRREDGSPMPKGDELKLIPEDIETYLNQAVQCAWSGSLATALLAQGSLDNQGVAKPSDFYFTAGQQKFLDVARKVLTAANCDEIKRGLEGPWDYKSKESSLGWDVTDDRVYALMSGNPSVEDKFTNPGPEALALLGLSLYPVFAGRERTKTQGCSGKWKSGYYSWPLWWKPASLRAVKSLLAHAYDHTDTTTSNRHRWYGAWGVFTILRSSIRRTDQGGYGTFGPAEVIWQHTRQMD